MVTLLPVLGGAAYGFCLQENNKPDSGYESEASVYAACEWEECGLRRGCDKAQANRTIELNHKWLEYKRKARELSMSEESMKQRSKRPVEVEAVLGQSKKNKRSDRFLHRGPNKVEVESVLPAVAHNLMELMKYSAKSCFYSLSTKLSH